jgi:hypothetical protein
VQQRKVVGKCSLGHMAYHVYWEEKKNEVSQPLIVYQVSLKSPICSNLYFHFHQHWCYPISPTNMETTFVNFFNSLIPEFISCYLCHKITMIVTKVNTVPSPWLSISLVVRSVLEKTCKIFEKWLTKVLLLFLLKQKWIQIIILSFLLCGLDSSFCRVKNYIKVILKN